MSERALWYRLHEDGHTFEPVESVTDMNMRDLNKAWHPSIDGNPHVSTVFLGLWPRPDGEFIGDGPFETMVFWPGHTMNQWGVRAPTRIEADWQFRELCEAVKVAGQERR